MSTKVGRRERSASRPARQPRSRQAPCTSDVGVILSGAKDLYPRQEILACRIHAPLLLLAGTDDPYTPIIEADSLYAHAPQPKSYWPVLGAGHEDLYAYAPGEYQRRVGGFLIRALRSGDAVASGGLP